MPYQLTIPTEAKAAEDVYRVLLGAARDKRHVHEAGWWTMHHYLNGARHFTNIDYATGAVEVTYYTQSGRLEFRLDDITAKYQTQLGRLLQIDLSPQVTRRNVGLDSMQKAALAQVALDSVVTSSRLEELKAELWPTLTKFGTIGLMVWNYEDQFGIEVVPPWELLPLPPDPMAMGGSRGLCRERIVPIRWVKDLKIAKEKKRTFDWKSIESLDVPTGMIPSSTGDRFTTFGQTTYTREEPGQASTGKDKRDEVVARLTEVFLYDSMGYLDRYDVLVGGKLLHSKTYHMERTYSPLNVAVDIPSAGFWGRSFISTLMHGNLELESALGQSFQNVQDIDAYGILTIPTTMGVPPSLILAEDGTKRLTYEPDYSAPHNLKPEAITPVTSGTLPIEVLKAGVAMQDKIANQPAELLSGAAPGRVDSSQGLGLLFELSNTPLNPTGTSVSLAMEKSYRAMLGMMGYRWSDRKIVEISMLDEGLLGLQIDLDQGGIVLDKNALPHPDEVNIDVAAKLPRSKEQMKMELKGALEQGIIDVFEYRIESRKRGLELPVGGEEDWQSYRKAMLTNIVLFNDGQTPGQVIYSERDNHEIHARILRSFMARPEFHLATSAVRDAFYDLYDMHVEAMGTLPEGMVQPEEAAAEEDMLQQLGAQMPPPGAVPGGAQ